ncbi:TetR/AcrR family transcriptional regulator [uncultured Litoreibacter sp.]|uniref:TetR/AcrR family transcriptional regulator n=1 Tax=uncultured Litoreibacter sp. TaxID=1392394 RepID=UPI00262C9405|nr:TetR/AcrR family transcriptional regulator [uncultured Litoreibacter sp.]
MPKIVDHDKHQKQLALRAASYFTEKGYAGGSMRKIAEHLGVSKSALYHYFPSKEALFLASTVQVMEGIGTHDADDDQPAQVRLDRLLAQMSPNFGAEMTLLFDYLRGKTPLDVREDQAMQIAMETYRTIVADIVGEANAQDTLALLLGKLLIAHLTGHPAQGWASDAGTQPAK